MSPKEEYKPWKWGATARYYASYTKTMLPTRKSVPRSSGQSDHTPDHRKVVWTCLLFIWSSQNHLARHRERRKKTRQTEEKVGRQQQEMNRPGVCQVPEGSGEQEKMEETDCEITSDAQVTLAVKGLMMMMMNDCTYGYSSKNKQTYKQTTTTATTRKQKQTKTTINW